MTPRRRKPPTSTAPAAAANIGNRGKKSLADVRLKSLATRNSTTHRMTAQNAAALSLTVTSRHATRIAVAALTRYSGVPGVAQANLRKTQDRITTPAVTATSAFSVEIAGPKMPNNTRPMVGAKSTEAKSGTVSGGPGRRMTLTIATSTYTSAS